jgi:hypothetical protein
LAEYEDIEKRDFPAERDGEQGAAGQDRLRHLVLRGGIELETFWTKWLTDALRAFGDGTPSGSPEFPESPDRVSPRCDT